MSFVFYCYFLYSIHSQVAKSEKGMASSSGEPFSAGAFIVANGKFNSKRLDDLVSSSEDAGLMDKFFKGVLRYPLVVVHQNLPASQFKKEFNKFKKEIKKKKFDLAVVYISTHGSVVTAGEKKDQTFLCFTTTEFPEGPDAPNHVIYGSELIASIGQLSSKRKLVILDSCNSGGIGSLKSRGSKDSLKGFQLSRATESAAEGVVLLAACKSNQSAIAGIPGQASPFTQCITAAFDAKRDTGDRYEIYLADFLVMLASKVEKKLGLDSALTIKADNLVHIHQFLLGYRLRKQSRSQPSSSSSDIIITPDKLKAGLRAHQKPGSAKRGRPS